MKFSKVLLLSLSVIMLVQLKLVAGEWDGDLALAIHHCNNWEAGKALRKGAGVGPDRYGETPLMRAIQHKCDNGMVTLLLENGSPVDAKDEKGNTALFYAVDEAHCNPTTVKYLLEYKAGVLGINNYGMIALDWATGECRAMLLKHLGIVG